MSVLIKNMEMPKGCIYANDNDQTEYCPLLNHDDVPYCQYIESEPEIAIGIDERPVYCPLSDVPEPCENAVSRQAAIDELNDGAELLKRVLDNADIVGAERAKYEWGLGLIESCISDMEELPSAQPEIIRCKDCKYMTEHYDTDGNAPYWTCSEWDSGTDYDGFCSYAERRTDETDRC